MRQRERGVATVLGLVIAVFAAGMLVGVSFLATPVKFLAPSLTLPVALDVGRQTFAIFNKTEWATSAALLLLVLAGSRNRIAAAGAIVVAILVAVEATWLLPELDRRVGEIIAGRTPPPSMLHEVYIWIEAVKLLALVVVAIAIARRLGLRAPPGV